MKANVETTGGNRGVKRSPLTPVEKLGAIYRVGNGESKASVARSIQAPESTLRGWCKSREKIEQQVLDSMTPEERERFVAKRRKLNVGPLLNQEDQATDLSMKNLSDGERSRHSSPQSTAEEEEEPSNNSRTGAGGSRSRNVSFRLEPGLEAAVAAAAVTPTTTNPLQHFQFPPNVYSHYRFLQSSISNFSFLRSAEEATAAVVAKAVSNPFWFGGVQTSPGVAQRPGGAAPQQVDVAATEEDSTGSGIAKTPSPNVAEENRAEAEGEREPPSRLREELERRPNRRKPRSMSPLLIAASQLAQETSQVQLPANYNAEEEREEALEGGHRFLIWLRSTSNPRITQAQICILKSLLKAFDA